MNLILQRKSIGPDGCFGELITDKGLFIAVTLEHAYPIDEEEVRLYVKLRNGDYTCKKGMHKLHPEDEEFETFEVTNVPGCVGILFHIGNFNSDSDGCILLGKQFGVYGKSGRMICDSKKALKDFLELQKECNEFTLKVEGVC